MNVRVSLLFLLLIYALFFYSCKKDVDTVSPETTVFAPSENSVYNTFDTLQVQAFIRDDRELTNVSVEILNADLISVVSPFGRNVNAKEYNLNAILIIDNIHLTSGTHYILISARDGNNTTRTYIEIFIHGIPFVMKGYISFENIGNQYEVHNYVWQTNEDTLINQGLGELTGGLIDNYNQQVGVLKGPNGPFECYPLYPFIDEWEIDNLHGGFVYCRAQYDRLNLQLGFNDQILSFYQGESSLKRSFTSDINYTPSYSLDLDNNTVVWQFSPGGGSNRIETFFASGALKQVTSYNKTVVGLEPKSTDQIYIISNEGNHAYMDIYNLESGLISSLEFENTQFNDACLDMAGNLYMAGSTGILKYNPQTLNSSTFSDVIAHEIIADYQWNTVVAASANELHILSNFGDQLQIFPLSGDCIELAVWYSK